MDILLVTTSYPRNERESGGVYIRHLASAYRNLGCRVTVLTPADGHSLSRQVCEGVHIVRFPYAPKLLMGLAYGPGGIPERLKTNPLWWLVVPIFMAALGVAVLRHARKSSVIHANWLASGLCALPARMFFGVPLWITLRGSDFNRRLLPLISLLSPFVDGITTVNERWGQMIRRRLGAEKTRYIPDGIVAAPAKAGQKQYDPAKAEVIVICMGALRWIKGADLIAQVASRLVARHPEIVFWVVGPGAPERFGLERLSNVRLFGEMPHPAALSLYREADLFFLPSRREGGPITLLEAMSAGLPCVASRLPRVEEVLTEREGTIVENGDVEAMVRALESMAGDPQQREEMGIRARKRFQELDRSWNKTANRFLDLFGEAPTFRKS